jgi:hypothetical protein
VRILARQHSPPRGDAVPEPPTTDLAQTVRKLDESEVTEEPGVAAMSKTVMTKVRSNSWSFRKSGPLEETWIERHQNGADCKCDVVVKKGFVTYICVKCGREI